MRGRVRGYQYASPDAFNGMYEDIDDPYVDGVSITHGQNPRQHIYTFASASRSSASPSTGKGTCPNSGYGNAAPDFVASNYICDSGMMIPIKKKSKERHFLTIHCGLTCPKRIAKI